MKILKPRMLLKPEFNSKHQTYEYKIINHQPPDYIRLFRDGSWGLFDGNKKDYIRDEFGNEIDDVHYDLVMDFGG